MADLLIPDKVLPPFTDAQKQQALQLREEISSFLALNREHKEALEGNFVEIGTRLATIRTELYWQIWNHRNFSEFMKSLDSRTQNYHCLGVARDLLPLISKEDLVRIGISKASVLRAMVKGGKSISPELIAMARDKTKEELEGTVAKELGLVEDAEKGTWFSFGGARMEDEERAEFLRTANLAIREGGLESEEITNWQEVPSLKKKQIIQVICAEFISTYAA